MNTNQPRPAFKIVYLLCALLLLIAIFNMPIAYYFPLRIAVFTGAFLALVDKAKGKLRYLFIVILLLFNPFFPVYLKDKILWVFVDIITVLMFLFAIYLPETNHKNSSKKSTKTYSNDKLYKS